MKYKISLLRILRTTLGLVLLVYLISREKFTSWLPYYTFQTNLMIGIWFTLAGVCPAKQGKPTFWMKDSVKGAITTYITITGLVYNLILIPYEIAYNGEISTTSIITHMIVPVIMILDYLLSPCLEKPSWKKLHLWLSYPIIYAGGTVLRAARIGFWPYPFIDPAQVASTPQLLFNYFSLILVHAIFAAIYLAIGRRKWSQKQKVNHL